MAQLKNTPQQQLTFDLERRKSYTFRCVLMNADRSPVDLTGSTLRLVVKKPEFDFDNNDTTNMIIHSVAAIDAPLAGEAVFSLQAAELDFAPGAYNYSIVLWTPEGYSAVMVKGVLNLHANTDSLSMSKQYFSGTAGAALELTMRGEQVVNIVANTLTRADTFRNIIGTGRPDNTATLEASTLQLVNSAPAGALFISLDGAGVGAWAWRKRLDGWKIVEGTPTYWPDIQNKPSSYPPSAHTHPVDQISATGNRLASNVFLGGDGTWKTPAVAWAAISGKPSSYPPAEHSHTWLSIVDRPSSFTPSTHTHPLSGITGITALGQTLLTGTQEAARLALEAAALTHSHPVSALEAPGTRDATTFLRGDGTWAVPPAGSGGGSTVTWASITDKPDTFPPETHGHTAVQISDATSTGRALMTAANSAAARTAINITAASTTGAGIVELATTTEATAGTDTSRAVTPAGLKAVADTKAPTVHSHDVSDLTATGTRNATTFLRGDNTWATPPTGGGGGMSFPISSNPAVVLSQYAAGGSTNTAYLEDGGFKQTRGTETAYMRYGGFDTAGPGGSLRFESGWTVESGPNAIITPGGLSISGYGLDDQIKWPVGVGDGTPRRLATEDQLGAHTHTTAQISDATATGRSLMTVGNAAFARMLLEISNASASKAGLVELATTAETTAGYDAGRAVTPAGLKAVADTKAPTVHSHAVTDLSATGTRDATTFLRGDGTWAVPPSGGTGVSTYLIVGPGRPDTPATTGGTITGSEPVGAEYRSTDGANVGAWVWMKRPSGWVVADGDTGWRRFDALFSSHPHWVPTLLYGQTSKIQLRRKASTVILAIDRAVFTSTGAKNASPLPAGFKVGGRAWLTVGPVVVDDPGTSIIGKLQAWSDASNTPEVEWKCIKANTPGSTSFTFNTDDPWPTTLPGTPA